MKRILQAFGAVAAMAALSIPAAGTAKSVNYDAVTSEFIDIMHKANIEVEVYTLNELSKLNGLKVDRVVTDYPIKIITSSQTASSQFKY